MIWYVVVSHDGRLNRSYGARHTAVLYPTAGAARRQARQAGDSVVVVEIDLTKEPIFIREKTL